MSTTGVSALSIQGRVLWALCLREIHNKHGKSRLGYLWELIKISFGIGAFWWIRSIRGFEPPHGMLMPVFLLMGFIPWYIFSESVTGGMNAAKKNYALLTFPQVTPLDLALSGVIVTWVTKVFLLLVTLGVLYVLNFPLRITDFGAFLLGLVGVGVLGFGAGLICATLRVYFQTVEYVVPMILRVVFFISGVFFSPMQLANSLGDLLMWNPVLNYIEMLRGAFITPSPAPEIKLFYVTSLTFGVLVIGLLLERYVRPLQESVL